METERRTHTVEMRVKDASYGKKTPVLEGYAANFNSLSEDLGGFREMLAPGCFAEALKVSDTRALFNHNPDKILGRTTSGTCRISEDERGLKFEIDPDMEISYVKDLSRSMARGDVTQCSFGFNVAEDGESWAKDSAGMYIRTITKVARLFDVSPVTYPAYASTSCAVRSLDKLKQAEELEKREAEEAKNLELEIEMERRKRELELLSY